MTASARSGEGGTWQGGRSLISAGLVAAGVGLPGWVVGLFVDLRHALFAYLTAYLFVVTIVLGALIFLMVIHAARAEWPVAFRGLIERIVAVFPAVALLFLPIALGIKQLYPWAGSAPASVHLGEVMGHQAPYLNIPFALVRAALFLGLWSFLSLRLIRFSQLLEQTREPEWKERQWRLSGIGLVLVALTLTFFGIDWVMSLTPAWSSTIFGFYLFAGGFVSAFSVIVLLLTAADRTGALSGYVRPGHYLSLGKLMLAFTIFWVYMAYAQYFIIWIADIPREASWYIPRSEGWAWVSVLLIVTHFVVPFAILLGRDLKRRPAQLSAVAGWIVAMHYLDMYWLVMPALSPDGPRLHWVDVAAVLLVTGVTVTIGTWLANGKMLVPLHDPDLPVAAAYEGT